MRHIFDSGLDMPPATGNCSFRFLSGIDLSVLHSAWLKAFSDYAVNVQSSREQFRQRLTRDGFRDDMSFGIFSGEEIVGFTLNGFDTWDGATTAYDVGTAIIPQYRGRHLGEELFSYMLPLLKRRGVRRYLLEVISTNRPAVTLYRKLGFMISRELSALALDGKVETTGRGHDDSIAIREIKIPEPEVAQKFWEWQPSWQNSLASLKRSAGEYVALGAFAGELLAGYGVVFPSSGNIAQLAVAKDYRRHGVASRLLKSLRREVNDEKPLRMINVDSSATGTLSFCAAHNFKPLLSQFEMLKNL